MRTLEGTLKAKIMKDLAARGIYAHMPVLGGYGKPSLDIIACVAGKYAAIETKAPGKKPSPRQIWTMRQIRDSGGVAFWTDSFEDYLSSMRDAGLIESDGVLS